MKFRLLHVSRKLKCNEFRGYAKFFQTILTNSYNPCYCIPSLYYLVVSKELMKKRIIALLIISGLICIAYFWLVTTLDWKEESRKKSPEEDIAAFHMQSTSEAGLAPYGDHVVLVPRYKLLGQYYTSPVFAGYCGQEFDCQWIDRQTLEITCTAEKIIKQEISSIGISIKYKIVNKATHNNRLKNDAQKRAS
jgi:hypothetical protein